MTHINVLAAYGTKNGSTAGITGMIVATMREEACPVDIMPAAAAWDVSAYDAMIVGGAFIARAMVRNGNGGDFRNPQRIARWAHSITVRIGQAARA